MSQIYSLKLSSKALKSVPVEKWFTGKTDKYLDLIIYINDEPDQYGNVLSAAVSQSQDERKAKAKKVYVGNGKQLGGGDGKPVAKGNPHGQAFPDNSADQDVPF